MKLHIKIEERPATMCFVINLIPDSILTCRLETTPEEASRIAKYSLGKTVLTILPHNSADRETPPLHLFSILNQEYERKFNRPEQALQTQGEIVAACKKIKAQVENLPDNHTGSATIEL
jgi:hypothetical protein